MYEQQDIVGSGLGSAAVSRRVVLVGLLGAAAGCGGGGGGQAGGNGGEAGGAGTAPATPTGSPTATPGGQTTTPAVEPPIMVRGQEANFHGTQSVAGQNSITVDLYDFYFEPTVLVGSPGQRITVNLLNEGEAPHTFTIDAQGIDVVLQPGQRGQAQVVFPESGQQEVVCRFHIAQGMLGLIVTRA